MRPAADFDLIVIGGGLTGAQVAREAATRGLKVLLLEREDLGAGASSGVEPLLHPEGADEVSSLREREHELEVLRGLAPFLFRKTAVLRPTPGPSASLGEKWSARDEEAHRGRSATRLAADEARSLEPGLSSEIAGALAYDEWCCDLGRLTTLTALSAERHGAELRTHTEVVGLLRQAGGEVEGVLARTGPDAEPLRFTARAVVNAAGAGAGEIAGLARLSLPGLRRRRQVRLVFAEQLSRFALALTAIDGRRVLAVPDLGRTVVGSAERELFGSAGDLPADPDEVGALLSPLAVALPSAAGARRLRSEVRVVASLARADGSEAAAHLLVDHGAEGARGLFTLVGGPPVLARVRAMQLVDQLCAQLRIDAPSTSHHGTLAAPGVPETLTRTLPLEAEVYDALAARHGPGAEAIAALGVRRPELANLLCPCAQVTFAEAVHALGFEQARTIGDLRRRCGLGLGECAGARCLGPAAALVLRERGANAEALWAELEAIARGDAEARASASSGATSASDELVRGNLFLTGNLGPRRG